MNAPTTRIKKEVRALFWPWCAVLVAGALPALGPHHLAEAANFVSVFVGIPLLATLPLGDEFQHRTLAVWLAQPVSRMQLWGEKMGVMFTAVASAALISGIGIFGFTWHEVDFTYVVAAIAYVVITMASATFWTLVARSIIGGCALIVCSQYLILLGFAEFGHLPFPGEGFRAVASPARTITAIAGFSIVYAGLMLWLGARKLARFQVTGSAGDDLLMAGPSVMPESLAGWFRCRPSGSVLNLIRKEFRLLRPLWLIELVVVLYVACLGMFRLLPTPSAPLALPKTVELALLAPLISVCIGIAGLAGTLSMGDERNSGTQAWHLTLPVPAGRQWLIKLVMAMLAGPACAVLFPFLTLMAAGSFFGSPFLYVDARTLLYELMAAAVLTFSCFWCACAANGTVRAAIWLVPLTVANYVAAASGFWLGQGVAGFTGTVKDFVVSAFHLSPLASGIELSSSGPVLIFGHLLLAFAPAMLFGLIQSRKLFRTQPSDSARWMLRCLMPVAAVSFVWCLSLAAGIVTSKWEPLTETRQALDKLHPGTAKIELSGEDLTKSTSMTAPTQRWLRGSSITVTPIPDTPGNSHAPDYLATIHLASGTECRLTVWRYLGAAASCGQKGR